MAKFNETQTFRSGKKMKRVKLLFLGRDGEMIFDGRNEVTGSEIDGKRLEVSTEDGYGFDGKIAFEIALERKRLGFLFFLSKQ